MIKCEDGEKKTLENGCQDREEEEVQSRSGSLKEIGIKTIRNVVEEGDGDGSRGK